MDLVGFEVDWHCVLGITVVEGVCKFSPCCMAHVPPLQGAVPVQRISERGITRDLCSHEVLTS